MKTIELDKVPVSIPLVEDRGLSEEEWARVISLVPNISVDGMRFDDRNSVYPCRIPLHCNVKSFPDGMVSLSLIFKDQRVSLIVKADSDIHKEYLNHPRQYVYVVGVMKSKSKDGHVYYNLYCRDVFFVNEKKGRSGSVANKRIK